MNAFMDGPCDSSWIKNSHISGPAHQYNADGSRLDVWHFSEGRLTGQRVDRQSRGWMLDSDATTHVCAQEISKNFRVSGVAMSIPFSSGKFKINRSEDNL